MSHGYGAVPTQPSKQPTPAGPSMGIPSDMASAAVAAGAKATTAELRKLKEWLTEGPPSFRGLAFLSGVALAINSALSVITCLVTLHWPFALVSVYLCGFGVCIAILEVQGMPGSAKLREFIEREAHFASLLWGRGLAYVFCGLVQMTELSVLNFLVGGFVIFVGCVSITVGRASKAKLDHLRGSIATQEDLRHVFNEYDRNRDGALDIQELSALCQALGTTMKRSELESALSQLDTNRSGDVDFDEFLRFWLDGTV